jgi:hypothetical protein
MQKLRPLKDEHFFIYHFLQCLPKEVRILLAHNDFADTRMLAEKADGLMAIHQPNAPDVTAVAAAAADLAIAEQDSVAAAISRAAGRSKGSRKKAAAAHRLTTLSRRCVFITSVSAIRPISAWNRVRGWETSRLGRDQRRSPSRRAHGQRQPALFCCR